MDNIIMWLTGGAELLPEIEAVIKLALMFYAYGLIVDLMHIFDGGSKRL